MADEAVLYVDARGDGDEVKDETALYLLSAEVLRLRSELANARTMQLASDKALVELTSKLNRIEAECRNVANKSLLGAQAVLGILAILIGEL